MISYTSCELLTGLGLPNSKFPNLPWCIYKFGLDKQNYVTELYKISYYTLSFQSVLATTTTTLEQN